MPIKASNWRISTYQVYRWNVFNSIHLKDTIRERAYWTKPALLDTPPSSNPRVLQKDQPPPGWSFCVFWAVSVWRKCPRPFPFAMRSPRERFEQSISSRERPLAARERSSAGASGLALAPRLLEDLAATRTVSLVSGTNGKTTTTAMIAAGWGGDVATNETGSNMPAGHVAALAVIEELTVVLEVDESWLASVLASTNARVVTLLNLSRDQLDRANEVRQTAERWRGALAGREGVTRRGQRQRSSRRLRRRTGHRRRVVRRADAVEYRRRVVPALHTAASLPAGCVVE